MSRSYLSHSARRFLAGSVIEAHLPCMAARISRCQFYSPSRVMCHTEKYCLFSVCSFWEEIFSCDGRLRICANDVFNKNSAVHLDIRYIHAWHCMLSFSVEYDDLVCFCWWVQFIVPCLCELTNRGRERSHVNNVITLNNYSRLVCWCCLRIFINVLFIFRVCPTWIDKDTMDCHSFFLARKSLTE